MDPFLTVILLYVGGLLIGLLILWLVIYTAVRSALTSHRQALAEEARPARPYVGR
ncbi:hypothetical protein [Microbacterium sp. APC 3901]|uniref:hypothetical protein n=1 Tax=Microbacterium sp. APC 3901 TaxID=3035192 RepID=UPI0025B52A5D|nr:hypothetical protein [Microbacterium sp. APC 3901]MDN3445638.1 hypothetical protein [Microbacterium sp. APC 3901]